MFNRLRYKARNVLIITALNVIYIFIEAICMRFSCSQKVLVGSSLKLFDRVIELDKFRQVQRFHSDFQQIDFDF